MAMGVSSYSAGRSPRRKRAAPARAERPPRAPVFQAAALRRAGLALAGAWPLLRLPLSLLAAAHIVLVLLYPGGRNALFGVPAGKAPAYLTLFQVPDTLGFYTTRGRDAFLVYKIYTQQGSVVEGVFPDDAISPKLRYDRWATAGDAAAGPHPELHAFILRYVLARLPSPPLRLELFAARWSWDRNSLSFPWPGRGPDVTLELRPLGNYNGLTRAWEPVVARRGNR